MLIADSGPCVFIAYNDQYIDVDVEIMSEEAFGGEDEGDLEEAARKSLGMDPNIRASFANETRPGINMRDTVFGTVGEVERGVMKAMTGAVDVTNQGINTVVGATTGAMVNAASVTPGLKSIVQPRIHSGFWEAYLVCRSFVHSVLRRELKVAPTSVFFTGHSLGGALATYAALDFTIHTLPRVTAYHTHMAK